MHGRLTGSCWLHQRFNLPLTICDCTFFPLKQKDFIEESRGVSVAFCEANKINSLIRHSSGLIWNLTENKGQRIRGSFHRSDFHKSFFVGQLLQGTLLFCFRLAGFKHYCHHADRQFPVRFVKNSSVLGGLGNCTCATHYRRTPIFYTRL
jgi:hypothetical protein